MRARVIKIGAALAVSLFLGAGAAEAAPAYIQMGPYSSASQCLVARNSLPANTVPASGCYIMGGKYYFIANRYR